MLEAELRGGDASGRGATEGKVDALVKGDRVEVLGSRRCEGHWTAGGRSHRYCCDPGVACAQVRKHALECWEEEKTSLVTVMLMMKMAAVAGEVLAMSAYQPLARRLPLLPLPSASTVKNTPISLLTPLLPRQEGIRSKPRDDLVFHVLDKHPEHANQTK